MQISTRPPGTPIAALEHRAGHPCLDFVNSLTGIDTPTARDSLLTPADYRTWAGIAGIKVDPPAGDRAEQAALARARALREAILQILRAMAARQPAPAAALEHLTDEAARAFRSRRLATEKGRLAWKRTRFDLDSVTDWLAAETAALLAHEEPLPLKRCAGEDCGWFFLDTSRNKSRHWCSMADCGNRAKARRHRARHQGEERAG